MKFIFTCPERNAAFETDDFDVVDNRGVRTDAEGNRILDARVVLNAPCPLCGQRHAYHASALSCPFAPPAES